MTITIYHETRTKHPFWHLYLERKNGTAFALAVDDDNLDSKTIEQWFDLSHARDKADKDEPVWLKTDFDIEISALRLRLLLP